MAHGCGSFPRGRLLRAPRYPRRQFYRQSLANQIGSGWRRVGREFLRDGVSRDRQRIAAREGPVLTMESLATLIGCGRRRVEGRGVSVAIDGAYMTRRKARIARGTGRRPRSGICQAIRGLAIMPSLLSHLLSCPKCKLQMQNCWIPHFAIFGKLQECKPQMQNRWTCS